MERVAEGNALVNQQYPQPNLTFIQLCFRLLSFVTVVAYCSYAYLYFFNVGATSVKPLHWYFFTIGLAVVIVAMRPGLSRMPRGIAIWTWCFVCYSILTFMYSSQSGDAKQYLFHNVQAALLLVSFLIVFQYAEVRTVRLALLVVALIAVPVNIIDFYSPTWSEVPGRASGLYVNPNTSGKALLFIMVATIPLVPSRFRVLYCLFMGIGMLVTLSRSAWLLWAVAVTLLAGYGYIVFKRKGVGMLAVGAAGGVIVYGLLTGGFLEVVSDSGFAGYLNSQAMARLAGGDEPGGEDSSLVGRMGVAEKSFEVFQNHPWFGAGLGYTKEWEYIEPHNMYLMMAAEGGVVGVSLFIALLVILWRETDSIGRILVVLFAMRSLFSHNMLEQPIMLIFIALVALSYPDTRGGWSKAPEHR